MIFKTPPADFKKSLDVVGCYLEHDGAFVLLHRPGHKSNGNKWGLPAGKVNTGEDTQAAMRRELCEETSVDVPIEKLAYLNSVFVRHSELDFVYHMYSCVLDMRPDITINPGEHQAYRWVTPMEALTMDLILDQDGCIRMVYGTMQQWHE